MLDYGTQTKRYLKRLNERNENLTLRHTGENNVNDRMTQLNAFDTIIVSYTQSKTIICRHTDYN